MIATIGSRNITIFAGATPLTGFIVDRFWRPIRTEFLDHEPGRLAIGLIVLAMVLESASAFDGQYSAGSLIILGIMCLGVVVGSTTRASRQIGAIARSLEAMSRSARVLRERFPELSAAADAVDAAIARVSADLSAASRFDHKTRRRFSLRWASVDRHVDNFLSGTVDRESARAFLWALEALILAGGPLVRMHFLDICRGASVDSQ